MKRTVRILALLFSVLFLSACAGERLADSSVDEGLLNTYDGISVRTEQSEYPVGTKEIRLVLVNNTEEKTGGYESYSKGQYNKTRKHP